MAPRGKRSLKASPDGIEKAEAALVHLAQSKTVLADKLEISRASIHKFFAGKSVGYENFLKICQELKLSWQEIADSQVCSSSPDPSFVGREEALTKLNTLVSQGAKVILVYAKGGVGKTTLARKYLQQQFGSYYIEFSIAKETQNITSVESLIEERLKQLGEEPGREFGVSLDRLKRKLETERIGVLIDNLEPALDGNGKIIEPHRRYVELLRVLAQPQVQSVTLITSRERLHESAITVQNNLLEGLDVAAWQEFFNNRNLQIDTSALSAIHKAYGGNAKAMEILSSAIFQDYEGNLEAYWQANQGDLLIERDLEDLVVCQLNRLQQQSPDAYKLLCRMGCYRYQDVPTVPIKGLFCMLWDVPDAQHRRVVKSLRERSLVEFRNDEYWLHPVIRAEAIARLRASEDWKKANHIAAEFWTESVKTVKTIQDALKALEAYYQYVEIEDFEQAGTVIVSGRDNKWETGEHLGRSFYRLGLLQQLITVITQIIENIQSKPCLSAIYNILGDTYWLTGYIHQSIKWHEKSGKLASDCLKSMQYISEEDKLKIKLRYLYSSSLVNIGLCKIELRELEDAKKIFEKAYAFSESDSHYHPVSAYFCLAFLNSCMGHKQEAYYFIDGMCQKIKNSKTRLNFWIKGYSLLFFGLTYNNLGETKKSFEMYSRAITYAKETHYTQVKAKALTGLAELYRDKRDFETAFENHSESIELLDKIGAKCDIAEAYYQLGLTYQKMSEVEKSQENFDKAIQLFKEMEAPKQVEKVEQARNSGG